nr:unnamed protein product [Callosobruchus analis]
MDELFKKKRNFHPELFLSTETISEEAAENDGRPILAENVDEAVPAEAKSTCKRKLKIVKSRMIKEVTTLEALRLDRKEYYTEKFKLEKDKIEQIKKRNVFLEQQDQLLQEKKR